MSAPETPGRAFLSAEDFQRFVDQGYNHIPVWRRFVADFDTPLSIYLKLAQNRPYTCLLESAQGNEKWGRYSIIGISAKQVIRVCEDSISIEEDGTLVESRREANPLDFLETFLGRFRVPEMPDLPRFYGGLIGYFGYDVARYEEPRLHAKAPPDTLQLPDILLMVSSEIAVFDNLRSQVTLVRMTKADAPEAYSAAQERLKELSSLLQAPTPSPSQSPSSQPVKEEDFQSAYGEENFKEAVERIKEYILAGDAMQVVLSQRMSLETVIPPINIYRALRFLNPSPYMCFMNLGAFQIVSASPETLARLENGVITSRPLAGTRRRGHTEAEDQAMESELLTDPKELAEHLMLIDLARNDVGRVSVTGSVCVTEYMAIERFSHVMHISSTVTGQLLPEKNALDLLRSTLPVGTLSGAPKIRAMEIIDELEPAKRGIYGGAIGYLAWNGNMDTAIAIRTAIIKDGHLSLQVGGGIVADSIPRREWKESLNKGRAIFRAVSLAAENFPDRQ